MSAYCTVQYTVNKRIYIKQHAAKKKKKLTKMLPNYGKCLETIYSVCKK